MDPRAWKLEAGHLHNTAMKLTGAGCRPACEVTLPGLFQVQQLECEPTVLTCKGNQYVLGIPGAWQLAFKTCACLSPIMFEVAVRHLSMNSKRCFGNRSIVVQWERLGYKSPRFDPWHLQLKDHKKHCWRKVSAFQREWLLVRT